MANAPLLAGTPVLPVILQSFFMGGFECATHFRRDRTRVDVLAMTAHDRRCAHDYRLLREAGITTARDGLRWHIIEKVPGVYDWSSFLPMLHASYSTHTQVLWDLCHWGIPEGLDPFSTEFETRFAAFAAATATLVRKENARAGVTAPPIYCPINEISFWAWVGGDVALFFPYGESRGPELKRQLVRASIAAVDAMRAADPTARFVQPEPIIHIAASDDSWEQRQGAEIHSAGQFEAWDMLSGLIEPELGGDKDLLDLIGVNYYWNNQWIHKGDHTPPGHRLHRPLHVMLASVWERYHKPILITETGAEAPALVGWLGYITAEVRQAQRLGIPVLGVCLYPVMDYPGWDDERHCPCGLIELSQDWFARRLRTDVCQELAIQQRLLSQSDGSRAVAGGVLSAIQRRAF